MTTGERKYAVGFIGIGKMGLPMASRIATQDYPLHVHDTSAEALRTICSQTAARAAKSLADLGRNCEVVILMLPDSEVVMRVLYGGTEALSNYLKPVRS
jgi:3-hydroxyisobutyrate dehydrogenase-like beta-hydroxyacid dehydrogenase